ncbi:MAG: hypothetical protein AAF329_08195, partial [Cyanobacteria bacterium P01_A01_bin.17]
KHLIHALALGTLLATAAGLSAHAQSIPQNPGQCPSGWVPAVHPVNPQLGCLPGHIQAEPGSEPTQSLLKRQKTSIFQSVQKRPQQLPPQGCAPGWKQATHPLNPQLGCLPTQLQATPSRPW